MSQHEPVFTYMIIYTKFLAPSTIFRKFDKTYSNVFFSLNTSEFLSVNVDTLSKMYKSCKYPCTNILFGQYIRCLHQIKRPLGVIGSSQSSCTKL